MITDDLHSGMTLPRVWNEEPFARNSGYQRDVRITRWGVRGLTLVAIGNVAAANLAYAATIPSASACFFSIAICVASLGLCPKKGSIKAEG